MKSDVQPPVSAHFIENGSARIMMTPTSGMSVMATWIQVREFGKNMSEMAAIWTAQRERSA